MRRIALLVFIICACLLLTGCSFSVPFIIENRSTDVILIKYEVKSPNQSNMTPFVKELDSAGKEEEKWKELSPDDYKLDKEKGIVEVNLKPNQGLQVATADPYWIEKEPYGNHFNLKNLSVEGNNGAIKLEGNQVFEMFQPQRTGWALYGPKYSEYVIRYKQSPKKQ